jgi:tRNA A-37 threonylcarbamoyl transferase component Bud32
MITVSSVEVGRTLAPAAHGRCPGINEQWRSEAASLALAQQLQEEDAAAEQLNEEDAAASAALARRLQQEEDARRTFNAPDPTPPQALEPVLYLPTERGNLVVGNVYDPTLPIDPIPTAPPELNEDVTVPHIQHSELAVENKALATGSFKSVYRARWMKKARDVAVLVLRNSDQAALSDMKNEIRIFGTLGKHKHLAVLLATCTQPQSQDKCMVMEFAPLGSLDHVLRKAEEDGVDVSNLVKTTVAMQVSEAMAHLHLLDVVHRDLAIRNVLVFQFDAQDWRRILVKVTDYGLSLLVNKGFTAGATSAVVEITTNSAGAAGPTRWMAPESILRRIYSKKTDVWALGVLLYEIWTLAMIPYYLISDDREVARMVVDGERLHQPDSCPDHVYVIMQECWRKIQRHRPSVSEIQTKLQEAFAVESLEASKTKCVVCVSAESVMALMPCGHRCACEGCGPGLKTCPMCRADVQEAKRIFG